MCILFLTYYIYIRYSLSAWALISESDHECVKGRGARSGCKKDVTPKKRASERKKYFFYFIISIYVLCIHNLAGGNIPRSISPHF